MNNFAEEYVRVINSITLDENSKEEILNKIIGSSQNSKSYTKKQVAIVSMATLAIVAGVSYFFKGNKIR